MIRATTLSAAFPLPVSRGRLKRLKGFEMLSDGLMRAHSIESATYIVKKRAKRFKRFQIVSKSATPFIWNVDGIWMPW